MSDTAWLVVAGLFQAAVIAVGFRLWGARLGSAGAARHEQLILIATATGGLLGAPFWWLDLPASFAWDLPPLVSRMLAAAGLAFGIAGCVVLSRPSPARLRFYFILIAVYLIPLAVSIAIFHLARFDFTVPITYAFFAIVAVLSAGSVLALRGGERAGTGTAGQVHSGHAAWFALAAVVLALWGLGLFAAPASLPRSVSFWSQDALTSRLIAAMYLTLAVAFALARGKKELVMPALVFGAVYGIGVSVACLVNLFRGLPIPLVYVTVFASIGVVSGALLLSRPDRAAQ